MANYLCDGEEFIYLLSSQGKNIQSIASIVDVRIGGKKFPIELELLTSSLTIVFSNNCVYNEALKPKFKEWYS